MNTAQIAATEDSVERAAMAEPRRRVARRWSCHVSVRVAHSFPLLAAGLLVTLRQVPGYDVALADEASPSQRSGAGGFHVLITDRRSDLLPSAAGSTDARCFQPQPRVILLTNEQHVTNCPDAKVAGVDVCLPLDCPTDELLAAVRQLGQDALGPLAVPEQGLSVDLPTRGGLAPGVLRSVRVYIEDHLVAGADLDSLARVAGMSCCHFSRAFKRSTGMPAHHYLITRRVSAAIALLRETDRALCEISLEAGFADQSHFTRTFVQLTGVTPGDFRHRCR